MAWERDNDSYTFTNQAIKYQKSTLASYQTSNNLYGGPYGGMENYFANIKTYFGQTKYDQMIEGFMRASSLYMDTIKLAEWHIYGSSRIGIYEANLCMASRSVRVESGTETQVNSTTIALQSYTYFTTARGAKRLELTNHLGNVLAVITDKKVAICSTEVFSQWKAELVSATDYSPFGAPLAGRTFQSSEYRFGFNGKENDNEVKGVGNSYDFGARIYDARLGKFITLDPLQFKFTDMSPYCYAANSPIAMIDAKGRNPIVIGTLIYQGVEIAIAVVASAFVAKEMHDVLMPAIHNTMLTYTKYSPRYDWQRRQEKAAERFNYAKDIAIKKMIDNHFNHDPDDPKNFNKFEKGLGLTLGGLALLGEVKTQLNEMKNELSQKADKTKNELETLRAKGTQMTDTDKKKLSNLTKQYDNVNQNLQSVQDAITQTDDLINKEKQRQTMMSRVEGFAPADNTDVVPPVIKQP